MVLILKKYQPVRKRNENDIFKEIGNIPEHRVSLTTRERVHKETEQIQAKSLNHIIKSKQRIETTINDKLNRFELKRINDINQWRAKTADSPFKYNQMKLYEYQSNNMKEYCHHRKINNDKKNLIDSLIGSPKNDFCTKERINKIDDPLERLALRHRRLKLEAQVLNKEKIILDKLLEKEIENIRIEFPAIANCVSR